MKYRTATATYANHSMYGMMKYSQNGILSSSAACMTWKLT